jgi:GT2 family glycosyltransferase/glycosyltransferase involved in cell wall biosynthesis
MSAIPSSGSGSSMPPAVEDALRWVEHAPFVVWLLERWAPRQIVELAADSGSSFVATCARHDPSVASLVRRTPEDAASMFANASIDLLCVGACRDTVAVDHDLRAWLSKMSDQGVILIHGTQSGESVTSGAMNLWAGVKRDCPHCEFMHAGGLGVLFVGGAVTPERAAIRDALCDPARREQMCGIFSSLGAAFAAERRAALRSEALGEEVQELVIESELKGAALSRLHGVLERVRAERDAAAERLSKERNEFSARLHRLSITLEMRAADVAQLTARVDSLREEASMQAERLAQIERELTQAQDDLGRRAAREHALECHVRELEAASGRNERQLREVSEECARMQGSSSWRLTAPLRALRRVASTRPRDSLVLAAAGLVRVLWRACPMTDRQRHRVRDWMYARAAPMLRGTRTWQAWNLARGAAHSMRGDPAPLPAIGTRTPVTGTPHPVRVIAMYLPQFHRIRENDEWWGDGFTEWTNVRRARPLYEGHAQPAVPHPDIGYYDLNDPEVLERQAALASQFGIHGFCFYYYWFGGRRLLERPLDRMLSSGRPDFPFCICWANESWTRAWDGRTSEVLIGQDHSAESDERFILDVLPFLRDRRYIRVEGKPLLVVYRPGLLPDARAAAARWRDVCRREGIGEIHLASVRSFDKTDPRDIGFDATIQFPPLQIPARDRSADAGLMTDPDFRGVILDYRDAAHFSCQESASGYRMYRGVMPSWDNTPRRMERATIWVNSSPDAYQLWLESAVGQTLSEHDGDHRLVFINAWNEWAEGAHLEPDVHNGYARLSSTAVSLGVTARGLDPQDFHQGSLPEHLAAARDWMWRRVCAICAGQLERGRLGFLEDYVSVLEYAHRHGCQMEVRGDVLHVRRGEREIQVSGRAGVVRIIDMAHEQSLQQPFCFVVLQFNKWDVTARCLESLRTLECERPLHVVLVDNGSDPEVVEVSARTVASMPNVHLIKAGRNAGFAAGNNLGYRYARDTLGARFIAIINNDTIVEDTRFTARCESIYREWGCSAIGPDVVTADGRHENPWSDAMFSLAEWRELERAYGEDRAHFERTGQARWRRVGSRTPSREVILNPILQGAAIVLTPAFVHAEDRAFDERTHLYGEEFLFAVRNLLRGHLSVYCSSLAIQHEEGVTTGAIEVDQKMRLGYVNAGTAAKLARADLDNALAAAGGVPISAGDPALLETLDPSRTEVLVDLLFCQPGYHGGGEYGKAVFRGLVRAAAARADVRIWAALDPGQFMEPWVLEECRRAGVRMVEVKSYGDIVRLVNADRFDSFFCPAIVVYTGYEYMRRVGTQLPFTCTRTRVTGTLLDIRDLQLAEERQEIIRHIGQIGGDSGHLANTPGSFLSGLAPRAEELSPMYAGICADRHVSALVTISEFCRASIARRFPVASGRLHVLFPSERPEIRPRAIAVPDLGVPPAPYGLMVSAGRAEKNAVSAILAFQRLLASAAASALPSNLKLVLVGVGSIRDCGAPATGSTSGVVCLPHLPVEGLEALIAGARFLLYPSFNEGFGYPPLEAMRHGVPSVVSQSTSIPEVCGDAAVYCDPMDVESIAMGIRRVLLDPPSPHVVQAQYRSVSGRQERDLATLVDLIIG